MNAAELFERVKAIVGRRQIVIPRRRIQIVIPRRRIQIVKGISPWPGRAAARARHRAGSGRRPK